MNSVAFTLFMSLSIGFSVSTYPEDQGEPQDEKPRGPIASAYKGAAEKIIQATLAGNDAYEKLTELCDDIGHRPAGSPGLEQAIDWAIAKLQSDGQENAHREKVMVPRWVRGRESLTMVQPRAARMPMLGLGRSVGTPPEGITAPVVVVVDEDELESLGDGARGKIVLFNNPMPPYDDEKGSGYGRTVRFRSKGARLAAEKGAVACLIRSVTHRSHRTPHTGAMRYGDATVKIPAAAITGEDADMLARFQKRGIEPVVTLKMEAKTLPDVPSANVVAELRGSTFPEEIVVIGGHIDAWDAGQGAHDDGAGCIIAMETINVLRKLNMIPKRTIRVVLWTNEEMGLNGGKQYATDHADELALHVAAIESDSGAFAPLGVSVDCVDEERMHRAETQLKDLMSLLEPLGATRVRTGFSGADVSPMKDAGVILMGHNVDGRDYFDYHHSPADTLDKVDPAELSKNVAAMATYAYILADMPQRLGDAAE